MENIKDKIKKLLALATSPNENEAKAAMLKARELMARNKLSEQDFEDQQARELKHINTDIAWTTDSGNIWMTDLCRIIAENYCCASSWRTPRGSRTHKLVISGMGEDADLCCEVIKYAVGFVESRMRVIERKRGNKSASSSYAKGFIIGLEFAFDEQKEEHPEWGLVVIKPKEVQEYENNLGSRNVKTKKTQFDPLAYLQGQEDGKKFTDRKVISDKNPLDSQTA